MAGRFADAAGLLFRLLAAAALILIFYHIPTTYLGDTFPLCLYRLVLGKRCIGCGTLRAFWSVLHLRFHEAFAYNRAVVVTFPLAAGSCAAWVFRGLKFPRRA